MTVPLFIIGAGGFGREVLSIVRAIAESGGTKYSAVFIDDRPTESNLALVDELGAALAGNVNDLAMRAMETRAVIAIEANAQCVDNVGLPPDRPILAKTAFRVVRREGIPEEDHATNEAFTRTTESRT